MQNKNVYDELIEEVKRGEHKKDILPDSSIAFEGEIQAMYFSNARKNMGSCLTHIIMNQGQKSVSED